MYIQCYLHHMYTMVYCYLHHMYTLVYKIHEMTIHYGVTKYVIIYTVCINKYNNYIHQV